MATLAMTLPHFRCSEWVFEVWPVHTVQFSNHTGYGSWKGRVFDARHDRRGCRGHRSNAAFFGECDGVLSGYMGSAEIGMAIM